MQLEVLLSCMNQKDWQISEESKITGNVLIVNQFTDFHDADHQTNSIQTLETMPKRIRMIFACEHGLSRSRNMAIQHAEADICLFCDDDEEFRENYEDTIPNAFRNLPEADLIAFQVEGKETRLPNRIQKLGFTSCLKIASYQIAFRRKAILEKQILFDVHMGAGSGNGCGEENKFLLDCRKAGLNIYYVPKTIAALYPKGSTWFFGYDQKFFYQRGAATRHMMGLWLSVFYGIYYLTVKYKEYGSNISPLKAAKELFRGILENPIRCQIIEEVVSSNL